MPSLLGKVGILLDFLLPAPSHCRLNSANGGLAKPGIEWQLDGEQVQTLHWTANASKMIPVPERRIGCARAAIFLLSNPDKAGL
jgi:hypothetical protein